jgi:hypothetical protein
MEMMKEEQCNVLVVLLLVVLVIPQGCRAQSSENLTRNSFPKGFVFGTAASAYQVGSWILQQLDPYRCGPRDDFNYLRGRVLFI